MNLPLATILVRSTGSTFIMMKLVMRLLLATSLFVIPVPLPHRLPVGLVYGGLIAGASTPVPAMSILGVAQHAIAAGSYGFILCKGKGLVQCGTANITADTAITSGGSSAGDAIDFADGQEECVFGMSLEAESANNVTFDAYINCAGA